VHETCTNLLAGQIAEFCKARLTENEGAGGNVNLFMAVVPLRWLTVLVDTPSVLAMRLGGMAAS